MIRFILTAFLFTSLFTYSSAQSRSATAEPTTQLDVFIDGKLHQLNDGDTLKVGGHEIVVRTSDTKHFDFGVLEFDYPKDKAFN